MSLFQTLNGENRILPHAVKFILCSVVNMFTGQSWWAVLFMVFDGSREVCIHKSLLFFLYLPKWLLIMAAYEVELCSIFSFFSESLELVMHSPSKALSCWTTSELIIIILHM